MNQTQEQQSVQNQDPKRQVRSKDFYKIIIFLLFSLILIFSFFQLVKVQKKQVFIVAVAGTNDIHGSAFPKKFVNPLTNQTYLYGGLIYMASILEILIKQFSNGERFLYFDAGDSYQGSLQSSSKVSSGQTISDFFNHVNLDAGAIGNHEFDQGVQFLEQYIEKINAVQLSANLINNNQTDTIEYDNSSILKRETSKIFEITVPQQIKKKHQVSNIKIGIIGLSTLQTKITSPIFSSKNPNYKLIFYKDVVVKQSQKLKSQGASVILVLSHAGNQCIDQLQYKLRSQVQQNVVPCRKNDQIFQLIDQIPQNTIHGVIQGHRHNTAHYFYKGIPFIGTKSGGYYLNVIYLPFTIKYKSIKLQTHSIMIQGPIPVCQKIFQNLKNCQYISKDQAQQAGQLQNWKFHNVPVVADEELVKIYNKKYGKKIQFYQKIIFQNFISIPIKTQSLPYQPLGNLMTNLIAQRIKDVDFMLINNGQFRTIWYPGNITYLDFLSMIPYKTNLIKFKITGKNIQQVFKTCQQGQKGLYTTWGIKQHLQIYTQNNKSKYKLIKLQLQNNKEIQLDELYTGITTDYLINGGDDFFFINQRDSIFMNLQKVGIVSQIVVSQIKKVTINDDFIDLKNEKPRIIITNASK